MMKQNLALWRLHQQNITEFFFDRRCSYVTHFVGKFNTLMSSGPGHVSKVGVEQAA